MQDRKGVSTALLRVELIRAAHRRNRPEVHQLALRLLESVHLIRLDSHLLDRAATLQPVGLRSLDAIHLAGALSLGSTLGKLVTYDVRMRDAAAALGLPTAAPA